MQKCYKCNKNITKKLPGMECSMCEIVVHDTTACSGLTTKQLAALRAADTLDWVCDDCRGSTARKRSFPSVDVEDNESLPPEVKKVLDNISIEIHKIVMKELKSVIDSVDFNSKKIDDFQKTIDIYSDKIKDLERKQTYLKNQITHLDTKIASYEQRVEITEQTQLSKCIEIASLPSQETENPLLIAQEVGKLLQTDDAEKEVLTAKRLQNRKGKVAPILVELRCKEDVTRWVTAARAANISIKNVLPNLGGEFVDEKVFVREALTNRNKFLLGKAKHELKSTYKYIWCKYGKVFVRKSESSKIYWIRNENDISSLASTN
ncbi:hypothetical protein O0L34_g16145 [Tuta absoluta]|nr:hypothetical protein O0L34_g18600 [Tuta absoluta]KAJ2944275.1 hypothetical protein O0L34_g18258 [Tuta absoluta]KAJ2946821.1 hypothetical protein O0L34_g16145 [Tuta absoluta]